MAYMIPESPREFKKESREGEMFHALENLPHEYYVVHSGHRIAYDHEPVRIGYDPAA